MTDQLFVRDPTLVMRAITSLRQQVETLKQDVSIWKASSEKWAQRHAEVHAQVETLTQELQEKNRNIERLQASVWTSERFRAEDAHDHMQGQILAAESRKRLEQQIASLAAAQERMTALIARWRYKENVAYSTRDSRSPLDAARHRLESYGNALGLCADELAAALPSLAASSRETTNEPPVILMEGWCAQGNHVYDADGVCANPHCGSRLCTVHPETSTGR